MPSTTLRDLLLPTYSVSENGGDGVDEIKTTRGSPETANTWAEEGLVFGRMAQNAISQLTVGPLHVFGAGVGCVFGIGLVEAATHLEPATSSATGARTTANRWRFVVR